MKIFALGLGLWLVVNACAQVPNIPRSEPLDPALDISTIPLWQDGTPGAKGVDLADRPTLTVFDVPRFPQPGAARGSLPLGAVIIAPGGGYIRLAMNPEGRQMADWFTSRGIVAFVLHYRLGARYPFPVPLQDEQRAIRLVRSRANEYGIRSDRIAVMGFSAGGHLAALASSEFDAGNSQSTDPVDRESSRPDLAILAYPWINAMQPSFHGMITYCSLIVTTPASECARLEHADTPSEHIRTNSPATFIFSTSDDAVVPVEASVAMYAALHSKGVDVEMHLFRHGKHGSGLGRGDPILEAWTNLLDSWLREKWAT